jgi:hypothetical protein
MLIIDLGQNMPTKLALFADLQDRTPEIRFEIFIKRKKLGDVVD